LLSLEGRESNDTRSLGEIFLYLTDEMSDITWIQAFQMLLEMFRSLLSDELDISEKKIDELVDTFMNAIPSILKERLKSA
jgi:ABC-type proline/glycine betaine transport system substrate-binding protein